MDVDQEPAGRRLEHAIAPLHMLLYPICSILDGTWYPLITIGISGQVRLESGVGQWRELT